ncbi:hypothetical protein NPIL_355361 [Nephila pilipes]|uniref:Uncharacterized protein n=1 Tax=Nephila pilipes TaxID=299642 RepID=A0A8X6QNJ3_NEPPI|nr:hypothetical protein NPIL_355361 [Nephila pilipes]
MAAFLHVDGSQNRSRWEVLRWPDSPTLSKSKIEAGPPRRNRNTIMHGKMQSTVTESHAEASVKCEFPPVEVQKKGNDILLRRSVPIEMPCVNLEPPDLESRRNPLERDTLTFKKI